MSSLRFEPLISPALWLLLAAASLGMLAWYAWRRPGAVSRRRWAAIIGLNGLGLALVLLILLNPTWVEPIAPPGGKPLLTVLVDATGSMATTDGPEGRSRYQAAARLAHSCGQQLGDRFEVKAATFAGTVTSADVNGLEDQAPTGQVTDLAQAMAGSFEEGAARGQALLLLSDGIHNAGGGAARVLEAARTAKALACPVYTWTVGGNAVVRDLAVELRSPQELAFVGQTVTVPVILRQRGLAGGRTTLVVAHEGKELERRPVSLTNQESMEERVQVKQDKPGIYRYEVRAEPLPEEVSRANNTATLLVRVVNQPVRVLLLEGRPYWDGKFLVRTLLADPSIELDSMVRLGESRLLRRTLRRGPAGKPAAAPAREEWQVAADFTSALAGPDLLRSYQVLVLGRDADSFLTEPVVAQLRKWLARDGGCLVCYRGQPTTQVNQRLGQLLPVHWTATRESRFLVHLTERGRDLHLVPALGSRAAGDALAQLPTLAAGARPEQPKPLAVVLATGGAQTDGGDPPVVSYQPYGTGRVVVIEGAGMWRWAFLPPGQQELDEVYRTLWSGLLRWLVTGADLLPGQKLALRGDKVRFDPGEQASATLLLREESARGPAPVVELRGQGIDDKRAVTPVPLGEEPGTFRVSFGKLPEGRYEARVAGTEATDAAAATAFEVRNLSEEPLDLVARPDLMARIAQESGGLALVGDSTADLLRQFREHQESGRSRQVQRLSAWDRWWVLLGIIGVWGTAWALRRSAGLI